MTAAPRPRPSGPARAALAPCLCAALALIAATGESHDAQYWIDRMEAALLPQASLRTEAWVTTTSRLGLERKARLRIARIQSPRRLRTLLTIWEEDEPVRIEHVVFDGENLRRRVFQPDTRVPSRQPISRAQHIGDTEFTYEDLAFADFAPREKGSVERRPGRERETVEITSRQYEDYGKVVTLLRADTALPVEVQFFDEAGKLFRTLRFSDFEKAGPYPYPTRAEVENQRSGRTSELTLSDTVIGPPIYEAEFSAAQIEKRLRMLEEQKTGTRPLF